MFDKKKPSRSGRTLSRQRVVPDPPLVADNKPTEVFDPKTAQKIESRQRRELLRKTANTTNTNPPSQRLGIWDEAATDLRGSNYFRSQRYSKDLNQGLKILEKYSQGVTIFGSRFPQEGNPEYDQARKLGQLLATNQQTVVTGGGPGIMEAANRGAYEAGGVSLGLNIHLPKMDERPNTYTTDSAIFHYFFARKVMLLAASKIFVFFPGGFGTLDELTEILVLLQEKKIMPSPVFLVGSEFWSSFDKFLREALEKRGFLNPGDMDIYQVVDDIEAIATTANTMPKNLIVNNFTDMQ
jgi:uncharacterized protein (TIGR00730 family)